MMTVSVEKAQLEAGLACRACGTPIPATPHYAARCPKCNQLHQAKAPAQDPA